MQEGTKGGPGRPPTRNWVHPGGSAVGARAPVKPTRAVAPAGRMERGPLQRAWRVAQPVPQVRMQALSADAPRLVDAPECRIEVRPVAHAAGAVGSSGRPRSSRIRFCGDARSPVPCRPACVPSVCRLHMPNACAGTCTLHRSSIVRLVVIIPPVTLSFRGTKPLIW